MGALVTTLLAIPLVLFTYINADYMSGTSLGLLVSGPIGTTLWAASIGLQAQELSPGPAVGLVARDAVTVFSGALAFVRCLAA